MVQPNNENHLISTADLPNDKIVRNDDHLLASSQLMWLYHGPLHCDNRTDKEPDGSHQPCVTTFDLFASFMPPSFTTLPRWAFA